MHIRSARRLAVLGLWALVAPILSAHHGTTINYDRSKQWTAEVVVTEFRYVNPHAQLYFERRGTDGSVEHFSGELLPNPAQLIRNGWTRKRSMEAIQRGMKLTVTVAPARAGGEAVLVLRIQNDRGEELLSGGPNAGGPEGPPPVPGAKP